MRRSPKTGRELRPARGYKGPKWLADLVHGRRGPNYTETLRFHSDDGITEYWAEYTGEDGLRLIVDAVDTFEAEKEQYQPTESWLDEGSLHWLEQVEEHARDLINHYFQQEYGYLPSRSELSRIERRARAAYSGPP